MFGGFQKASPHSRGTRGRGGEGARETRYKGVRRQGRRGYSTREAAWESEGMEGKVISGIGGGGMVGGMQGWMDGWRMGRYGLQGFLGEFSCFFWFIYVYILSLFGI